VYDGVLQASRRLRRFSVPRNRLSAQSQDPPRIPPWRGASGRSSEHADHTIAEQAVKADDLVDEAIEVGDGRHEA
jgi:hypothetical protein